MLEIILLLFVLPCVALVLFMTCLVKLNRLVQKKRTGREETAPCWQLNLPALFLFGVILPRPKR